MMPWWHWLADAGLGFVCVSLALITMFIEVTADLDADGEDAAR